MLTVARRARGRLHGDDGFTLVEMLVAMIIASIVGALSLAWFMSTSNASTSTTDADNATASARNVLQTWGKMLQLAGASAGAGTTTNGVLSLAPTSIKFTAYLTNSGACGADRSCPPLATSAVTLGLMDAAHSDPALGACTAASVGQLVEIVGGSSCSVVESDKGAATDPSGCLFTAYTSTGSLGCSSDLTASQLSSITSVVLAFKVMTTSGNSRSFQTTSALTN